MVCSLSVIYIIIIIIIRIECRYNYNNNYYNNYACYYTSIGVYAFSYSVPGHGLYIIIIM